MHVNMDKEDNMDVEVHVDKEEMSKTSNCTVEIIIMDQCSVDIVRDLDILNLIVGKREMNKKI